MKVFKILFLLLITVLVPLNAQVTYFTNVSDKQIKTLQVKVAGEMFSDPFIELGGENRIEVNFDAFNPGSLRDADLLLPRSPHLSFRSRQNHFLHPHTLFHSLI